MVKVIDSFSGEYSFLSNFYQGRDRVRFNNMFFPTVEHAFQAAKAKDVKTRFKIAMCLNAGTAKKVGRQIPLRADWEDIKDAVMFSLLLEKFKYGILAEKLLQTGDAELIEGNYWHDNYWGDCKCEHCKNIKGKNKLGKMLMQIRSILQQDF